MNSLSFGGSPPNLGRLATFVVLVRDTVLSTYIILVSPSLSVTRVVTARVSTTRASAAGAGAAAATAFPTSLMLAKPGSIVLKV